MVTLTAVLIAAEGKGDVLEKECKKMVPKVLKEPGAVAYSIHRGVENPNKFLIFEQYESADVLKAHSQTEHFKAFVKATQSIVAGGETTLYNKVA